MTTRLPRPLLQLLLLMAVSLAISCQSPLNANDEQIEITVFAAASLTDAFTDIASAYETANPDTKIWLNFGGSSQLAAQLREGVPADVFASANPNQMVAAINSGRINQDQPQPFASNRLTIIVPHDNPEQIQTLNDLAQDGTQLIVAAPAVPIRAYTDTAIADQPADFQSRFYANIVSEEENVRQIVAKIALGEADAGIVYISDITTRNADQIVSLPFPEAAAVAAVYPIAPVADSREPETAQAFIDFVLSPAGQEIVANWGFKSPADQ